MASVEVNHLVAGYGNKTLIRNLSFNIPEPSFIAVIGHNGSGKTTFFKALTRQLSFKGTIRIHNQPIKSGGSQANTGLSALLAQKNAVGFSIPVKELIVMGRFRFKRFFQPYDTTDYQAVTDILQALDIEHLSEKDFLELSGGEQQMVWLAQLMAQDTKVYLLDEPTQHLDVYNKKRVFKLITKWVQEYKKTVFCITHDLHYLYGMEGYLLNLSAPTPELERIFPLTLDKNIKLLEEKYSS